MASSAALDGVHGKPEIADLPAAILAGFPVSRIQIAAEAPGVPARPLIPGTEEFASDALVHWHRARQTGQTRDLACYTASDAIISGAGQVWIGDRLVTSPEIMPPYVAQALGLADGGVALLHHCARLPARTVDAPCLVALGSASENYGHFLVEIMFRLLIARRAQALGAPDYRVLLDDSAPKWLLQIMAEDFGISPHTIELFDPWRERVTLREAILPTRVFQDPSIHPFANALIEALLDALGIPAGPAQPARIFVARDRLRGSAGVHRRCVNERRLLRIAEAQFGFVPVFPETLPWRAQIAAFRNARIVLGQAGSGLHNALFCRPETRLASIGLMNLVQSEIGALRRQHNAFLMKDVSLSGDFTIDEDMFAAFLAAVCEGAG
jgi:capsular polysaccharide biosynthesis protein